MLNGTRGHMGLADYSPGQLRSTKSYIFKTEDVLGEGATSRVFEGRNKKSGEKVAVKAFNNASYERPNAVQEREFSVLLRIKHENIVQLLAIENDQISKQRIIIMEVCDCSVLNMLDKPKYIYGFPEDDFLEVLRDTTAGMKYLQEEGIVHRDIKPGNIMRRIGPDRQATYKLADFGAARELQDNENFVSLYGTEEYLHPAMFGRALLRQPLDQPFTAKVDLWSLGVTLYHIATGLLPFRPFGGRKNRTTMHKITTQKTSGVISAVQRDSENGPVMWSTELPKHCRLSIGLKLPVTDLLAGLLECNTDNMWSFETYFHTANSVVSMRVVDVLNVATSQLLKIYIDPNATYAEFQEHVAMQTNVAADQQVFLHDDQLFHPDVSVICDNYPTTSEDYPMMMVPKLFDGSGSPIPPDCPSMPQMRAEFSLERDYPYSRLVAAVLHFLRWKQEQLFTLNRTNDTVAKAVSTITNQQIMQLSMHLGEVALQKETAESILRCQQGKLETILELLDAYLVIANGSRLEGENIRQELTVIQEEVEQTKGMHETLVAKLNNACMLLQELQTHREEPTRIMTWRKGFTGCQPHEKCQARVDVAIEDIENIMTQFRKHRKLPNLPYNEEQIHKMDKARLNQKALQATSLISEHCISKWRDGHSKLMTWFCEIAPIQRAINDLDILLTYLVSELPKFLNELLAKRNIWDMRVSDAKERLAVLLKKPRSPVPLNASDLFPTSTSSHQRRGGSLPAPIKICYPPDTRHKLQTTSPSRRSTSLGHESREMITVPRSLKQELEAHSIREDAPMVPKVVADSQRLMKEMQEELSMGLGIPDQPDHSLPNHINE